MTQAYRKLCSLLRTIYVCRDWPQALLVKIGLAKKRPIRFRNGYTFFVGVKEWSEFQSRVNLFWDFPLASVLAEKIIKIPIMGRELNFYFGKYGTAILGEVFKDEVYKPPPSEFNIKGRAVVDIGCSYGDSSIYFAWLGAKDVYGFEPSFDMYELAKKNIEINDLNSVHLIHAGVGGKRGSFFADSNYYKTEAFTSNKHFNYADQGEFTPLITLEDIVTTYKIENAFMKIDCEGYEYDIITKASDEVLSHFDYIVIEYHYGYEELEKKLRDAGFKIWHDNPRPFFELEGHGKGVGNLIARRSPYY